MPEPRVLRPTRAALSEQTERAKRFTRQWQDEFEQLSGWAEAGERLMREVLYELRGDLSSALAQIYTRQEAHEDLTAFVSQTEEWLELSLEHALVHVADTLRAGMLERVREAAARDPIDPAAEAAETTVPTALELPVHP